MKKIFTLISLLIITNSYAYKTGDKVDDIFYKMSKTNPKNMVIVDFFASWCASCEKELPLINNFYKNNKNENVKVIGIDTDEDVNEGIAFQKKLKINFNVLNDNNYTLVNKFNPKGMPALFYIKDSKVVKVIYGAVDNIDQVITKDLESLNK